MRLDPNNAAGHDGLGIGLESKAYRQRALEEYRKATTLDPANARYRQDYARLLAQVNK